MILFSMTENSLLVVVFELNDYPDLCHLKIEFCIHFLEAIWSCTDRVPIKLFITSYDLICPLYVLTLMVLLSCGDGLCSVLTPYYNEDVLYSLEKLKERNVDGITMLYYLKTIVPGLCSDVGMPNAGADSCDPYMCPYMTCIAGWQLYFLHSNNCEEIFATRGCWMKTIFGMCI